MQRVEVSPRARRIPGYALWIIGVIALGARLALFPYVSEDSTNFLLPWMQEFRDHGATALGGEFSNYNFPYLFLMFLGSLLPLEPLFAIKFVSLVGDVLLALSVGSVVRQLQPARLLPATAALLSLFLPTVLLNSSMWGQCDSIYTAFLLFSLRSILKGDSRAAWLWWGISVSFKLQAVFFLPALVLISLRKRDNVVHPAMAALLWGVLSAAPILFGRSLASTFGVYVRQTQEDLMVAGAANIYVWFPTASAASAKMPAILLTGFVLLFAALAYWRGPDSPERRVLLAVAVAAICPLLLPQMHDRYFYVAEVLSVLLLGHKKVGVAPWLFAATGLCAYFQYLTGSKLLWPLMLASIVQCIAVVLLLNALWRGKHKKFSSVAAG